MSAAGSVIIRTELRSTPSAGVFSMALLHLSQSLHSM
jgi:hypothetical protein